MHFGGTFNREFTKNGPSYTYDGGQVHKVGKISVEWVKIRTLLLIITKAFAKHGPNNINVYTLNDGIRFRVDNDDDLKFQWETLPSDQDGVTHIYCINGVPTGSKFTHELISDSQASTVTNQAPQLPLPLLRPLEKLPVKRRSKEYVKEQAYNEAGLDVFVDMSEFEGLSTQESFGKFSDQ